MIAILQSYISHHRSKSMHSEHGGVEAGDELVFHLACTMPMRSALPSSVGACPGPLSDAIVSVSCVVCWEIGVRWWVEWTAVG